MTGPITYLARHRWAAVGLAIVVEAAILLPMAYADPSAIVGIPAAVTAAIAGTVAVVFGPLDGALVALVGAVLFGSVGGWGAGELAALGLWPAIVAAAGLFGRRVERQRRAFAEVMTTQEAERQRIALELHDETAQDLTAALLALKQAESAATDADAAAAAETSRRLIQDTIRSVRDLAVELRPKALDDFGLAPAVERLAADVAQRTGVRVEIDVRTGDERLPKDTEVAVFRAVQEVLGHVVESDDAGRVARVLVERGDEDVRVAIDTDRLDGSASRRDDLTGLRERVRLIGGRVSSTSGDGRMTIRVVLPL